MPIPDYQTIMLPLLKVLSDGYEHSFKECIEKLAAEFKLTENERKELLPSGRQPLFDNRVGWANTYLKKSGLIESPKRGVIKITPIGKETLKENINKIDVKYLKRFDAFNQFYQISKKDDDISEAAHDNIQDKTPDESIDEAYNKLRAELVQEILAKIKDCSPDFFEKLVVDLLLTMGYGGSRKDAGEAIGKSGDGGIDGIIKEDRLGLDVLYIQAKRWGDTSVGRPEIQKFAGALLGQKAKKGIFTEKRGTVLSYLCKAPNLRRYYM